MFYYICGCDVAHFVILWLNFVLPSGVSVSVLWEENDLVGWWKHLQQSQFQSLHKHLSLQQGCRTLCKHLSEQCWSKSKNELCQIELLIIIFQLSQIWLKCIKILQDIILFWVICSKVARAFDARIDDPKHSSMAWRNFVQSPGHPVRVSIQLYHSMIAPLSNDTTYANCVEGSPWTVSS